LNYKYLSVTTSYIFFNMSGFCCFLAIIPWSLLVYDSPYDHPRITPLEIEIIQHGRQDSMVAKVRSTKTNLTNFVIHIPLSYSLTSVDVVGGILEDLSALLFICPLLQSPHLVSILSAPAFYLSTSFSVFPVYILFQLFLTHEDSG
jgi:hypothetical protein